MKLETLNIWGGRVYEPLINHLHKQSEQIDVFCFQEVYSTPTGKTRTRDIDSPLQLSNNMPARANIYQEITGILSGYDDFYRANIEGADYLGSVGFELYFGNAVFVAHDVDIRKEGEVYVYRELNNTVAGDNSTNPRSMQYVQFMKEGKLYTIANLHGLWNGKGKKDAPERIEQSRKVKAFLDNIEGPRILCGDFNLEPETESLRILEDGMRNLVKEYGVKSTRTTFYDKPVKFADYILVTPDIKVVDFRVIGDEVSDHSPLFLEFD